MRVVPEKSDDPIQEANRKMAIDLMAATMRKTKQAQRKRKQKKKRRRNKYEKYISNWSRRNWKFSNSYFKVGLYRIHVADPDGVETKNLPYQNFKKGHVGQNKAQVMMDSYESVGSFSKYPILTQKQMGGYDLIICCVDNIGVRRTLYNTSLKWLDLRAQGRNAALISHKADVMMYDTLLKGI